MFSPRTMMEHHLRYNHWPAVSLVFVDVALEAVDAVSIGDPELRLRMPNDVVLTAGEIVEQLHLESFVLVMEEEVL